MTIVCIKTTAKQNVKEGEIFTIKSLCRLCNCDIVAIDIGLRTHFELGTCSICRLSDIPINHIWWLHEMYFAPLDTLTDLTEINEILSQPVEELFKIK